MEMVDVVSENYGKHIVDDCQHSCVEDWSSRSETTSEMMVAAVGGVCIYIVFTVAMILEIAVKIWV